MALHYADTSAVVKYYLPETGSGWVATLFASEPIAISLLTLVEIASALGRRTRDGDLTPEQRDRVWGLFLRDLPRYVVLGMPQRVAYEAAALLLTSSPPVRVRALDAIHLATAQWSLARARRRGVATGNFVTADRTLAEAAAWAGLPAVNPEDYP